MHDDRHPVAAKAPGWPTVPQVGHNDAGELPRFVQVIKTEQNGVGHPIVLTKNPLHLRQKHAVPEKFLAQEIVEDATDQRNSNEPPLAAELAVVSGGRSFLIRDARALDETFATIARELRYQYLLGYTPARPGHSGAREWRSIRVRVKGRNDVRVRARDGYTTG